MGTLRNYSCVVPNWGQGSMINFRPAPECKPALRSASDALVEHGIAWPQSPDFGDSRDSRTASGLLLGVNLKPRAMRLRTPPAGDSTALIQEIVDIPAGIKIAILEAAAHSENGPTILTRSSPSWGPRSRG